MNPHGNPAPKGNQYAVKKGRRQVAFSMSLANETLSYFVQMAQAQGIAEPTNTDIVQEFKAWVKERSHT